MDPRLLAAGVAGLGAGLYLLVRGFGGYRMAARIGDTAASRIASAAVGELLVTGIVEAAELTLVSPLQCEPCVFYRARIDDSDGDASRTAFRDERAVGFRVRDATGELRVFPRGARFDVPARFDERTGSLGEEPAGLRLRTGGPYVPGGLDREAQIAALLTVLPAGRSVGEARGGEGGSGGLYDVLPRLASPTFGVSSRTRHYTESRLGPGDVVTVVGRALPFDQLDDPEWADRVDGGDALLDDPEIAADLAAARAAGTLEVDPDEAWGNAAIPGFGIGRPVRPPELDAGANAPPLAQPTEATRYARTFEIAPDALVMASAPDVPLVISLGAPAVAAGRHEREFLIGLLGAVLAIVSAVGLAILVDGGLGG